MYQIQRFKSNDIHYFSMSYNKELNYCTMSPDELFGVRFNFGCYLHDRHYRNEVKRRLTRKQADSLLKQRIQKSFNIAGKPKIGKLVSWVYYIAVRLTARRFWV